MAQSSCRSISQPKLNFVRRVVQTICLGMLTVGTVAGFYWQRGYVANILSAMSPENELPNFWSRTWKSVPLPSRKAIGDPERIRWLLPVGRTELLHTKGGFAGTVQPGDDLQWHQQRKFACVFESLVHRTIESNDGVRVVELRRFESVRTARLFSEAEHLELALGPPDKEILRGFPPTDRAGMKKIPADRLADAMLDGGADVLQAEASSTAYLQVDSLSGKTVRITYVDGQGVVSVEPVGCTLSDSDRRFLAHTCPLADAYLAPATGADGQSAPLDASYLTFLFDPSLRQVPRGSAEVESSASGARQAAATRIRLIPAPYGPESDPTAVPEGKLNFGLNGGRVESAVLQGDLVSLSWPSYPAECVFPQVLGDARQPVLRLSYSCAAAEESSPIALAARADGRLLCLPGPSQSQLQSRHLAGAAWHGPDDDDPFVDLVAARMLLLAMATGCFWCGRRLARRGRAYVTAGTAAVAVGLLVTFSVYVHGRLYLAELLPLSSAIVLGNWIPPGAALVIGILSQQRSIPPWRRAILILVLAALGGATLADDSGPAEPLSQHQWSADGVCIQTAPATCSACAAATLLAYQGINASEAEMAHLCLSKKTGTPLLGLYRGLKLKTRGTRWDVDVIRCSFDELKRLDSFPAVLSVRLGETYVLGAGASGRETKRQGGTCHAIVLFGFLPDGRADIGDPSQYRHDHAYWPADDLKNSYMGEGIRLVQRRW